MATAPMVVFAGYVLIALPDSASNLKIVIPSRDPAEKPSISVLLKVLFLRPALTKFLAAGVAAARGECKCPSSNMIS